MYILWLYLLSSVPSLACLNQGVFTASEVKKVDNGGFILSFKYEKCTYTIHDDDGFALLLAGYASISVPLKKHLEREHKKSKDAKINLKEKITISKEQQNLMQAGYAKFESTYNAAPSDVQEFLASHKKMLEDYVPRLLKGELTRQELGALGHSFDKHVSVFEYKVINSCSDWTKEGKYFPLDVLLPVKSVDTDISFEKYNEIYPNFAIQNHEWKESEWNPNNPTKVVTRGCNTVMDGENLRLEKK